MKGMTRKRQSLLLIASSALLLAAMHAAPFWRSLGGGLNENRKLAPRPGFPGNTQEWRLLPTALNAYVTDHFPPRGPLIGAVNFWRYRAGYSTQRQLFVGVQGWLFHHDGTYAAIALGKDRFDAEAVRNWTQALRTRDEYLRQRGIRLYVLVAPRKETIYPEQRPAWMGRQTTRNEVDNLVQAAGTTGFDRLIYPRDRLMAARQSEALWDAFDSHWTGAGAYIAYSELASRMALDHPALAPLPRSRFVPVKREPRYVSRDLAKMLGIADHVGGERLTFAHWPVPHPPSRTIYLDQQRNWRAPQILLTGYAGGTLLMLRDSFSEELLPFLKAHFSRIVLAHVADGFWRSDLIEQHKPDIVLLEIVEDAARQLMASPKGAQFNTRAARLPPGYECLAPIPATDCNIDRLNDSVFRPAAIAVRRKLDVHDWAVMPGPPRSADAVFMSVTEDTGSRLLMRARPTAREDVARHFRRTDLHTAGFAASADLSQLQGAYSLQLLFAAAGKLYKCNATQKLAVGQ